METKILTNDYPLDVYISDINEWRYNELSNSIMYTAKLIIFRVMTPMEAMQTDAALVCMLCDTFITLYIIVGSLGKLSSLFNLFICHI